jgi:hypothetical protein
MQETWFNSEAARAYVGCKTVKAWYAWRKAHGIVKRTNGTVNKADLDRALKVRKDTPRRGGGAAGHPNSLANLRRPKPLRIVPQTDVA